MLAHLMNKLSAIVLWALSRAVPWLVVIIVFVSRVQLDLSTTPT
jgi:hypothetical protein